MKYAYAVTCHKAQGGQWKRVFLDQGYMTEDMLTPDYFRWLYTAFTRATETLYLVNWPKEQMNREGNEVKDLVTSTLCFRILHFIQNDNNTRLVKSLPVIINIYEFINIPHFA